MILGITIITLISASAAGYISFVHEPRNNNGKFSGAAIIFIILTVIALGLGIYLAVDNNNSNKQNEKANTSLQNKLNSTNNKLDSANNNLRIVLSKLDSLGYKFDPRTGNITQINITNTVIDQSKESKVREITDKDLRKLFKEDPPKDVPICFFYYRYPDRETESVKAQIRKLLEAKGFTNICPDNDINSEYPDNNLPLPKDDSIQIQMEEDFVRIGIPPRKT